jgi:hypothetical protein
MLVQIDENSATLTPYGSLARQTPANARTGEDRSWAKLLRAAFSQISKKRTNETPAE